MVGDVYASEAQVSLLERSRGVGLRRYTVPVPRKLLRRLDGYVLMDEDGPSPALSGVV